MDKTLGKDDFFMLLIPWNIDEHVEAYTSTRMEGFSKGGCSAFNLAFNVNDRPEDVLKNRILLAETLHTDLHHMVCLTQTHSTHFLEVSLEKDGGKGMYTLDDAYTDYDAMYTRSKDLYLMVFHADCIPVLIYAKDQQIVGAIHAGWKGNVHEITLKFVQHLIQHEHCDPKYMYAYIGPSIEQKNFEVQKNIIDLVQQMSFDTSRFYTQIDETHYLLNGKELCKEQLLICNVPNDHISISPYCTIEHHDLFFSYRQDHQAGRNVSIIKLK